MGGKASIMMILGFNLIFMVAGYNYSRMTMGAIDNEIEYIDQSIAHNIAVSGANMAANRIFLNQFVFIVSLLFRLRCDCRFAPLCQYGRLVKSL